MSDDKTAPDEPGPEESGPDTASQPADAAGSDESLSDDVAELLASVRSSVMPAPPVPDPVPSGPKPPPLPAREAQGVDESLAIHVDELLASVSESVSELEPMSGRRLVEPRGAFVILGGRDLAAMRRFYERVVGGVVSDESDTVVRLSIGDVELLLTTAEIEHPASGIVLRIVVDDVALAYERLLAAEVEVGEAPSLRPWGREELVVADPAGHLVALSSGPAPSPRSS
jgi:uncharacterized glyoxalase superfamily protein PhnB